MDKVEEITRGSLKWKKSGMRKKYKLWKTKNETNKN